MVPENYFQPTFQDDSRTIAYLKMIVEHINLMKQRGSYSRMTIKACFVKTTANIVKKEIS